MALFLLGLCVSGAQAQGWGLTREHPRPGHHPGVHSRPHVPTPRDPSARRQEMIRRYRAILASQPGEDMAFSHLLTLVRERDGSLDHFASELEQELTHASGDYALLMLSARLAEEQAEADRARERYTAAAAVRPERAEPSLALARLALARGDRVEAARLLEASLPHVDGAEPRRELWRQLGQVALEANDLPRARAWYQRVVGGAGAGVFSRAEFARALAAHGLHAQAATEYARLAHALSGDPRVLAPILRAQAREQLEAGDADAAIATARELLRGHRGGSGARAELLALLEEAHRRLGRLPEFAEELARTAGRDADEWALVGRLRDEAGDTEAAAAAYRHALITGSRDLDTRERLVHVLVRAGRLDDAIEESRTLVRMGRGEPRYLVALVRLLVQTGQRDAALSAASAAGRSQPRDASFHRALAELYDELDEGARATAELETVLRFSPQDSEALIALGTRRLGEGDRVGALAFFRRIARSGVGFRGPLELGQVLADHDLLPEAEHELRTALRMAPHELSVIRALASVLERSREGSSRVGNGERETESAALWARVLELSPDEATQREAREHVVLGSIRRGASREDMAAWRRAYSADPPDLEAGRFLAMALLRQRPPRRAEAAALFEQLLAHTPGDLPTLHSLERVRTLMGDRAGAVEALERLVQADPRNAADYLGRMAEHAHALYRDEDALRWAAEAARRAPDDASANRRLGELLRARQDMHGAVQAFEQALVANPRLFDVRLMLAEIHLAQGESEAADAQYRSILTGCRDDELVLEAARASMRIHLAAGSLPELEAVLLPLAVASGSRPIFRRLLVEVYDRDASPLIETSDAGGPGAEAARDQLVAMGRRALSPLLEALADEDPAQRGVALRLLAHLGRSEAASPLLALAERDSSLPLRLSALRAAATICTEAEVPRLVAILSGPERRLHIVAAFALARAGGRRALVALRAALDGPEPDVRAFAALGLGAWLDTGSLHALADALARDRAPAAAAAIAWACGRLLRVPGLRVEASSRESLEASLSRLVGNSSPGVAVAAAMATASLGTPEVTTSFSSMLFGLTPSARFAAARGLTLVPLGAPETLELPRVGAYPSPSATLTRLLRDQAASSALVDASAAVPALTDAANQALAGPQAQASWALRLLAAPDEALGELLPSGQARTSLAGLLRQLGPNVEEALLAAASRPSPEVRRAALLALAGGDWSHVAEVTVRALDDPDASVRQAALSVLLPRAELPTEVVPRVVATFARSPSWAERLRGAQALGTWADARAVPALLELLADDHYAFVREAAAVALGHLRQPEVDDALRRAAADDLEPRVRAAASLALAPAPSSP